MKSNSKIASIIRARYNKIKEINEDVFDKVELNKNLYHNVINADDNYEWDYSLFDPYVWPVIRNYLARTNPSKVRIQLEARNQKDFENRDVNQDVLNWELNEILLTNLFMRIFYSGYIAGKGYLKTGWNFQKRKVIKTPEGREIVMSDLVNHATAKFVRFNDLLLPNRNEPELTAQPYLLEVMQLRVGDLLDENEQFGERWDKKWLESLRKDGELNKALDFHVDLPSDSGDMQNETVFRSSYVNFICMRTKDNEVLYIPLEGDDKVVNKDQENEFWHGHYPYIDFTPFPEDDEFYTMSIVDAISDLQMAANETLNQGMTNQRQVNNQMWLAGSSAAQTPDWQFVNRPNGIIRTVGEIDQIQPIRQPDNLRSSMVMAEALQTKIERSSGISSLYSSGASGSDVNQTARGAIVIDKNIDTNVQLIVDLFSNQVIKRLGEHFLELNAQYITEEQTFNITGKKGVSQLVNTKPDQISANFKVAVTSEYMLKQTPASKQASLQNLITVLAGLGRQSGVTIDLTAPIHALTKEYPEMDNIDDVVISDDEKGQADIAMIGRGQLPEVKQRDNHKALMEIVQVHLSDTFQDYPESILQIFAKYLEKHTKYLMAAAETAALTRPENPAIMGNEDMALGKETGLPQEGQPGYNLSNNLQ